MAGSCKSAPLGCKPEVQNLNDGTHVRVLTPRPGPIGTHIISVADVHVMPGENIRTLRDEEIDELNRRWKDSARKSTVGEYLVGIWLDDYYKRFDSTTPLIVETTQSEFTYLFDIKHERLIAAWGFIEGKNSVPRDKSRMAGHPSAGPKYHKGHVIPHSGGGGTDINLVPQRGALNIGAFRKLERIAVSTPGSFYFTHWKYPNEATQKPSSVEQGLLCPHMNATIKVFKN